MINFRLLALLIVFQSSLMSCQTSFEQKSWLESNDFLEKENPRLKMVDDLMENHLKVGMSKKEVIQLLGKPLSDTTGVFLSKGLKLPDSLKIDYNVKRSKEENEKALGDINKWYRENYKSAPFLSYPLGWSMIDPISLEIRLNSQNLVADFRVKEH